jgi:hypothetical protein
MSTTTKTVKSAEERLAIRDEKIKQLQKQKQAIIKRENAKERKARTNRLCRRHGLLEKFMPNLITITDDQFEAFVRTGIVTSYGIKRLGEIMDKGADASAAYIAKCRAEEEVNSGSEPSETNHSNGTDGSADSPQAVSSGA